MVLFDEILENPKLLDLLMRGNYGLCINSRAKEDPHAIQIQHPRFSKLIKWIPLIIIGPKITTNNNVCQL